MPSADLGSSRGSLHSCKVSRSSCYYSRSRSWKTSGPRLGAAFSTASVNSGTFTMPPSGEIPVSGIRKPVASLPRRSLRRAKPITPRDHRFGGPRRGMGEASGEVAEAFLDASLEYIQLFPLLPGLLTQSRFQFREPGHLSLNCFTCLAASRLDLAPKLPGGTQDGAEDTEFGEGGIAGGAGRRPAFGQQVRRVL